MRLVCLSDTHNQHRNIAIPEGDVLIHAGDCTDGGTRNETNDFLKWFAAQPHAHKILVPGNHDFFFEKAENLKNIPPGIHLLLDQGLEIDGINFWGSPVTPGLSNWAFNRERGSRIKDHWKQVPGSTDILITHTPPYGILDTTAHGINLGCEELSNILPVVQPNHHLFGHIHHSSGHEKRSNIDYHNLSVMDERQRVVHSPIIIDLTP